MKSLKGGAFERELCVEFSQWWTGGKRTDVFWRTAGSGARATTRAKKGKATFGSHGDIMAMDPLGIPFVKMFTVELKRGYSKHSFHDIIDHRSTRAEPKLRGWIKKASNGVGKAGSLWWMVVHRRDRREPLVFIPRKACFTLFSQDAMPDEYAWLTYKYRTVFVTPLKYFFQMVDPKYIISYMNDMK